MKKLRGYVETSVVGGAFDKTFDWQSEPFWDAVKNGDITIIASDLLEDELKGAPLHVRKFFYTLPESQIERVVSSHEAGILAKKYIAENVVGQSSLDDCRHIAIATIANADVLVSWNFRHIVNRTRINGYNSVNMKLGYPQIDIRPPYEVIHAPD